MGLRAPLSSSCAAAKKLQTWAPAVVSGEPSPCPPRPCHPTSTPGPIALMMRKHWRRIRGSGTTSACSAASSATRCASRRARRCSTWSSASARPRSASIATTTSRRGASSRAILNGLSTDETVASCAPSAISRISPTSPRTSTISAGRAPTHRGLGAARRHARAALEHARAAGARRRTRCARFFDAALVSPVLTAHPTEVRRKSTIDREMEVARLLDRARPRPAHAGGGGRQATSSLRRAVLTLWQTSLLRRTGSPCSTRSRTASPITTTPFCTSCRGSSARSRTGSDAGDGSAGGCPRSCAWELDRRRPRRQSLRDGRGAARHAAPAEPRSALLSRGAARARRRAVA